MKKLNAIDPGYFHCFESNLFVGYIERGYLFAHDSPNEKELASANEFGKLIYQRYESNDIANVEPYDKQTATVHKIECFFTNKYTKSLYSNFFREDENCNSCDICLIKCPAGNISKTMEGKPVRHSNCLLCANCELNSPENAVHSPYKWAVFSPLLNCLLFSDLSFFIFPNF